MNWNGLHCNEDHCCYQLNMSYICMTYTQLEYTFKVFLRKILKTNNNITKSVKTKFRTIFISVYIVTRHFKV